MKHIKGNKLYVKWKGYINSLNCCIDESGQIKNGSILS